MYVDFLWGDCFLVIMDVLKRRNFRKLALHSKVVLTTSIVLIVLGTVLLKFTEHISLDGGFFS